MISTLHRGAGKTAEPRGRRGDAAPRRRRGADPGGCRQGPGRSRSTRSLGASLRSARRPGPWAPEAAPGARGACGASPGGGSSAPRKAAASTPRPGGSNQGPAASLEGGPCLSHPRRSGQGRGSPAPGACAASAALPGGPERPLGNSLPSPAPKTPRRASPRK